MSQIKTAVSLYSLQDSYARGRLDLSGILDFVASTGAQGVEILSDQMIKGTPNPSDETLKEWCSALDKSGLVPVCNDIFVNSTIYRNRTLRVPEQVDLLKQQLDISKKLGFDLVRLVSNTAAEVTEATLPYAEELGITMALEIHAGMSFSARMTAPWLDMMKRVQSEYLGIVVDFGIFCSRFPRISTNYFKSLGLNQALADKVEQLYVENGDLIEIFGADGNEHFPESVTSLIKTTADEDYVMFSSGYENTSLDVLDEYLPYIKNFHGKFYEMTDEGYEYSIDYPKIITRLNQLGYDGYIASEYEGNRFIPIDEPVFDQEEVRAHQAMLAAHINEGK